MLVHYLSHPEVNINPDIPMSSWGLNHTGKTRVSKLIEAGWLNGVSKVISSAEAKAIETANPIAYALSVPVEVHQAMHENNRTATGYLPSEEFELVASQFFANPYKSIRGWEKAIDAQRRIVSETEKVLRSHIGGNLLIVGHGAVGTLLFCHYSNFPISRQYDQKGSGNYFSFLKDNRRVLHWWRPMEHKP
ncbi:MAG: histidine phosphatase family protein [Hyphomicrobiales bacterium]|nr:histidine phosphatase family protein [Hyphomicrobiales bacterium]